MNRQVRLEEFADFNAPESFRSRVPFNVAGGASSDPDVGAYEHQRSPVKSERFSAARCQSRAANHDSKFSAGSRSPQILAQRRGYQKPLSRTSARAHQLVTIGLMAGGQKPQSRFGS